MKNRVPSYASEPDAGILADTFQGLAGLLAAWKNEPDALIEILHAAQLRYGWLSRQLLGQIAQALQLPPSLVYGVASFYHAFRLTAPAELTCTVCTGTSCHLQGGSRLWSELNKHFRAHDSQSGTEGRPALEQVRCLGACGMAPLIRLERQNGAFSLHGDMDIRKALLLLDGAPDSAAAGEGGSPAAELLGTPDSRFVLENCGVADPEDLETARAAGAYEGLIRVIHEMTPDEVCRTVSESRLRGRGGGGYPTGLKWEQARQARGKIKYVVANGDEGDPGAFMDRTLMEYDPHRVLEGMAIAAYAIDASQGFVYVRGEYPLAARRLRLAIRQAEQAGLLGNNLLGSGFSFRVRVRIGAGAFVCGEETALMASIMGRRGQPVIRPPYPTQKGLWKQPTLINNVETFANIPPLINSSGRSFRSIGTSGSSGTKVFSVSGDVARVGVIEVPLGTTLRQLLDMAGGVTGGELKAAQTGGASGGCIPASHADLPIDFDSLHEIGTIMGSGGLVVLNDKRCMVDLARFFMSFCSDESCGKCTPCRAGTQQARQILDEICCGRGSEEDLVRLEELCHLMQEASLCGLGMAAPTPVLSTLRWYRDEYLAHLHQGCCPAGVCSTEAAL